MPTIRRGLLDYDRPTIPADAGPDYSSKHKNKSQNPCLSAKIICAAWEARDSLEPSYRGPTRRRKPRRPLAGKKKHSPERRVARRVGGAHTHASTSTTTTVCV